MKQVVFQPLFISAILIMILLSGCKKDEEDSNKAPNCQITAPQDGATIEKGDDVTITVEATDSDGTVAEVRFFVDGLALGTDNSFPYSFVWETNNESEGTHDIKATSLDNKGGSSSDEISVIIADQGIAPTAAFEGEPTTGLLPLAVSFNDLSSGSPDSWDWDFGDGETSSQQNPSHAYNKEGTYTVSLTVSNDAGSDTEQKEDYITVSAPGDPPVAAFSVDLTLGQVPFTVQFTDLSTNNPTSWQWNFGDGGTSNAQDPSHTYNTEGYYTVSLSVSNMNGSSTETKSNYILVGSGSGNGDPCPGLPVIYYMGEIYNTIQIGSQCWLRENLKYDTGNNWCYDDNPANCDLYGRLYDWATIMNGASSSNMVPSGVQGICPDGWHVPSDEEWKILEGSADTQYGIGNNEWNSTDWRGFDAGKRLKSVSGWYVNSGTDIYGYTMLPCGYRGEFSGYEGIETSGYAWTSTESSASDAWFHYFYMSKDEVGRGDYGKTGGFPLRCMKD